MERCLERGRAWEEVVACVVREDGDRVLVDTAHPAYPRTVKQVPLSQRLANFAKAAAKHVAAGMPMCTQEEIDRRFAICQGCEFYKGGSCLKCGCPLVREKKFVSKLSWAKESCPVGKWGPVGQ